MRLRFLRHTYGANPTNGDVELKMSQRNQSLHRLSGCLTENGLLQYSQFCLVGLSGLLVDMAILWFLSVLGFNISLGKLIASEAAILNNFCWNERWTFQRTSRESSTSMQRLRRLKHFNLISLIGVLLSVLLLDLEVYGLAMNLFVANFIAISLVSGLNYWMSLRFAWPTARQTAKVHKTEPFQRVVPLVQLPIQQRHDGTET